MRQPDANSGRCDRCEEYSAERYLYEYIGSYGPDCDFLCEACYPKCTLCNSEFAGDEDLCESCEAIVELEEKA